MSIRFSANDSVKDAVKYEPPLAPAPGKQAQPADASTKPPASPSLPAAEPKDVFSTFSRYTTPTPPPKKWEFFWNEFKANARNAKRQTTTQYAESLKEDKHTRWKALLMVLTGSVGVTIFRRLRRTFTLAFMLAFLAKPIVQATQSFPQLEEAYEEVKKGNPTKGKEMFRQGLDDSFYSILQDFLRPLSIGITLAMVLEMPCILKGEGDAVRHRVIRLIAKPIQAIYKASTKNKPKPLEGTTLLDKVHDNIMEPVIHTGDKICNKLRKTKRLGFLNWIEN